jgi:hypothetical protein
MPRIVQWVFAAGLSFPELERVFVLTDPLEHIVVSSLGWVDGGELWILDTATGRARSASLGHAKYLSLHEGRAGFFAVMHHHGSGRFEVTAHSFSDPEEILSRCWVSRIAQSSIEGSLTPWQHLPKHYVAHLTQPTWADYALVTVSPSEGVSLQRFEWYDDSYDKGSQGVVGVTEIPDSHLLLISVQRSSKLVVYDPVERRRVREIALAERGGNPVVSFRRAAPEIWASDYDTIVKMYATTERVLARRRLQDAPRGTAHFVGQFAFDAEESICAVARPFSGDVLGLDPKSLRTKYRATLGRQPYEVALLQDGTVFARDWKTGDLLRGTLRHTWLT